MGEFRKPRRFNQRDGARSEGSGFDRSKFFGKKKPEGGFDRGSRFQSKGKGLELFKVTCEKCGKETEVPFKPTGSKPVYCRDCFKGESPRESRRPDNFEHHGKEGKRYDHFESKGMGGSSFEAPNASSDEFSRINKKLDKIMKALKID